MQNSQIRKPGCYACKAKRVKCDRQVPSCQRCLKSGKLCPGYSDTDPVFRDMAKYAEDKVSKRVKDRLGGGYQSRSTSLLMADGSDTTIYWSLSKLRPLVASPKCLPGQIGTNWEEIAIPRFYADYIFRSDSTDTSFFKVVPEIISRNSPCDTLNEALRAVALINLANQNHQGFLALEANRSFHRAVGFMAKLLQDPIEAKKDSTLAASFLFGIFNVINGYNVSRDWTTFHTRGRTALLELKGDEHFKTRTSCHIWGVIFMIHMAKWVTGHIRPPDEADKWLELAKENNPTHDLSMTILQHARLGAKAQALFDDQRRNEWWVINLLKIVKVSIQIDEAYQKCDDEATGIWRYKEIRSSSGPNQHLYHDIIMAAFWNRNRGFRIHLHEVLLHCCTLIQSHSCSQALSFDFESTRKQSTSIIAEMIADIIASMAFCLGRIDSKGNAVDPARPLPVAGYFTMFPLYLAMVSAEEGSETQSWLRAKLEYVSDVLGVGLAGKLAHREKRDPWNVR